MNLNVYRGNKGVKKVKSLTDIDEATNLGVLQFGVTVLLSKTHVEFTVALEGKRQSVNDVVWLGYYYSSSFLKFQKIFKKSIENVNFENISSIVHNSLVAKLEDPYSSPLYIIGNSDSRASWNLSFKDVSIHIPLHRSDSFHTLQGYPVIYMENDIQILIGGDLDRNQLFPSYPKVDSLYTQTLHNIDSVFSQNKWSVTVVPKVSASTPPPQPTCSTTSVEEESQNAKYLLSKNQFDLEKLSRWFMKKFSASQPLTFVYGASLNRKGVYKTLDLLTLKTLQTGKTYIVNLVNTFKLSPNLDFFKDQEVQKEYENSNLLSYIQNFNELEKDCQNIKILFPGNVNSSNLNCSTGSLSSSTSSGGSATSSGSTTATTGSVSIYNPFFDKYSKVTLKVPPPLTLESSFLANTPSLTTYFNSVTNNSSGSEKPSSGSVVVDPISLSSSSSTQIQQPLSTTPFISISSSPSSPNENILDKLKILDKKRQQSQKPDSTTPTIDINQLSRAVANILRSENYI
ncbi:hypothetical protein DLAC_06399 [Tieghemostelium lacteum]|uniref:Uncharacterized protein n=1 Tax=Tieghemostelium lacteum TaxID=361077 RepID=A0A151ZET4_TIELA|nr:hypothetical protein DLAC_06399 [Tieghemostelium lacteum]|eukprot:KYQ92420.1 hypothetical protein DLAC_06399 [Tieghemostelium lacteum]